MRFWYLSRYGVMNAEALLHISSLNIYAEGPELLLIICTFLDEDPDEMTHNTHWGGMAVH